MRARGGQSEDEGRAEEAARWVARLQSSDATERDRQDFQLWLRQDASHQDAYDEFAGLWAALKDVPTPANPARKRGTARRSIVGNLAAIGIVALLSWSLYRLGLIDRMRADYYTAVGEVRNLTLADGTRVDLNTDTAIAVHYSPGERRIELLRGEAFFEVAKNPARPFLVDGSGLMTKALGTRYGVRATSGRSLADVQVEEGRVEVRKGEDRIVLEAGEVARLTGQGHLSVRKEDIANVTAWRSGKLVFSARPLREVLTTLERYRAGRIVILDQAAAERTVSGIFDLTDTDNALQVLENSLPVSVTRLTGMMVVVRSR